MLELDRVSHRYAEQLILDQVSLHIGKGEVASLLGPSGCGKTTVLRCIAGFETLESGSIMVRGTVVSNARNHVAPEIRKIGMVFQDYALLPHLTVQDNILFALHDFPHKKAQRITIDMLDQVGLASFAKRYPHELSGGQQQRVAIARALAPAPALLLMDEPFSNLDAGMRRKLGGDIKSLLNSLGITALIATHDHQDAFALSDRVGVMHEGKLLQWDSAYNIYHQPRNHYVANFVGRGVWLPGRVKSNNEVEIEIGIARGVMATNYAEGTEVDLFLRPDDIVHDDKSTLQAEVIRRQFRGSDFLYELRLPSGASLLSLVPSHHDHAPGEMIGLRLETDHMVVFPRQE